MKVHVLQHVAFEGIGSMEGWLKRRAATVTHTRFFTSPALPANPEFDLVIAMGGPMSVHDEAEFPWLAEEKRFLRAAMERQVPVLGVCLGAQLIASALEARVCQGREKEIGWFDVEGQPAADAFCFPERIKVFHWHGRPSTFPRGAASGPQRRMLQPGVCIPTQRPGPAVPPGGHARIHRGHDRPLWPGTDSGALCPGQGGNPVCHGPGFSTHQHPDGGCTGLPRATLGARPRGSALVGQEPVYAFHVQALPNHRGQAVQGLFQIVGHLHGPQRLHPLASPQAVQENRRNSSASNTPCRYVPQTMPSGRPQPMTVPSARAMTGSTGPTSTRVWPWWISYPRTSWPVGRKTPLT